MPAILESSAFARDLLIVAVAYGLGCLVSGYYLVRWRTGGDIRDQGSGGAGATNAGRVLGRPGFLLTLCLDLTKGTLAAAAARWLGADTAEQILALLAVVAGHIWPVQLGFRGGKGIAPFLGALAVAEPRFLLGFAAAFALAYPILRRFTLAGLVAVALLPAAAVLLRSPPLAVAGLAASGLLILIAHRRNLREEIARLLSRRDRSAAAHEPSAPASDDRGTTHRV